MAVMNVCVCACEEHCLQEVAALERNTRVTERGQGTAEHKCCLRI
jgi:hypothetical protein